jgi:hypothetical protein
MAEANPQEKKEYVQPSVEKKDRLVEITQQQLQGVTTGPI